MSPCSYADNHGNPSRLPVTISWGNVKVSSSAFVDSGCDGNIIDSSFAHKVGIKCFELEHPIHSRSLEGVRMGDITHITEPVTLVVSGNHSETIRFHVFSSPDSPIVLGKPWLDLHEPHISWATTKINGVFTPSLAKPPPSLK